jgi:hypothetical protein
MERRELLIGAAAAIVGFLVGREYCQSNQSCPVCPVPNAQPSGPNYPTPKPGPGPYNPPQPDPYQPWNPPKP